MRRVLSLFIVIALSLLITTIPAVAEDYREFTMKAYSDVRNLNLSHYDLRDKMELLLTLTFDSRTMWPKSHMLPKDFDPEKILEYGKNPGLGIKKLHSSGYTGKGVRVAYIDQPISAHEAYDNANIVYEKVRPETQGMDTSMHGPGVLSLLAGKEIGVAPDSTVYFFGHPAWLKDQTTHAEALKKLIDTNKTLPKDKKIRIAGFSDAPDEREDNIEAYKKAIQEAEANNIMVFDVTTIPMATLTIQPFKDKDDFSNYKAAQWIENYTQEGMLYVPGDRTTAVGSTDSSDCYGYWINGGFSWGVPYIVGVISLGLQVDPSLTKENAISYLHASAYPYKNGGIINPEGFVRLVEANKSQKHPNNSDYYFTLYNSKNTDVSDLQAIKLYVNALKAECDVLLKDTRKYSDASQIYQALKTEAATRKGNLKGIQIFGTSEDVPAFDIKFKIQMAEGIDESGAFKSDFFYSTFKNNIDHLKSDFSIYKAFQDKLNVTFSSEWPVSRLPLSKGEIAGFIKRYADYVIQLKNQGSAYLVNFSSPIFAQKDHSDDMAYFIKERLDKEFHILKSTQYRLYGNKQGYYPVTASILGDFTAENLKGENKKGIINLFINGHGQSNNIDQTVFETNDRSSEKRVSLINTENINQVLSDHYYTLTAWTCSNAWNLSSDNIIHEAMAKGKCVNAISASAVLSNNGVNNKASLEEMKKNNFYYFQYEYFKGKSQGKKGSLSFQLAQKAYADEIIKNTSKMLEGNYQFNLNNVLVNHYLGLLEYPSKSIQSMHAASQYMITDPSQPSQSADKKADEYENVSFDQSVSFTPSMESHNCSVSSLKAARQGDYVVFSMDYNSGIDRVYSVFNPPSGDIFMIISRDGIPADKTNVKFKIEAEKLRKTNNVTIKIRRKEGAEEHNYVFFYTSQLNNLINQTEP